MGAFTGHSDLIGKQSGHAGCKHGELMPARLPGTCEAQGGWVRLLITHACLPGGGGWKVGGLGNGRPCRQGTCGDLGVEG